MPGSEVHRQHYDAWLADPVTDAEWTAARLANAIFDAHRDDTGIRLPIPHR